MKDTLELLIHLYQLSPIPLRMAYGIWCAFIGLYIYAHYHDQFHSPDRPREITKINYSNAFVLLGILTVIVYFLAKTYNWPIHLALQGDELWALVGLPIMLIGLALVGSARAALNGYWGPHIYKYLKDEDNVLITRGVYSKLRHPIYLGQVLMAIGTLLLSDSTVFLMFAAPLVIINFFRSRFESEDLKVRFPGSYQAYKNKTSWLCPGLF